MELEANLEGTCAPAGEARVEEGVGAYSVDSVSKGRLFSFPTDPGVPHHKLPPLLERVAAEGESSASLLSSPPVHADLLCNDKLPRRSSGNGIGRAREVVSRRETAVRGRHRIANSN